MEVKRINTVRVVKAFPGYEPNDVLRLDDKVGLFKYAYNDAKDSDASSNDGSFSRHFS